MNGIVIVGTSDSARKIAVATAALSTLNVAMLNFGASVNECSTFVIKNWVKHDFSLDMKKRNRFDNRFDIQYHRNNNKFRNKK